MGSEVPITITRWDLGFLRGLYGGQANLRAPQQRGDIQRRVASELAMPYSNSDGMQLELVFEGQGGARYVEAIQLPPKPKDSVNPAWQTRQVAVPANLAGRGQLTLGAGSPSGDGTADWVFVKKLALEAGTP